MNRLFTKNEYLKVKESVRVMEICRIARERISGAYGGIKISLNPEYDKSFIRTYYLGSINKNRHWVPIENLA